MKRAEITEEELAFLQKLTKPETEISFQQKRIFAEYHMEGWAFKIAMAMLFPRDNHDDLAVIIANDIKENNRNKETNNNGL